MTLALAPATRPALPDRLPQTVEELRSLADLHLATGWALAATVWAWTYEGTNQHAAPGKKFPGTFSISEFAELGIRGLSSRPAVRKYRAAWQAAIDHGIACSVAVGDAVELPEVDFRGFLEGQRAAAEPPGPGSRPEPDDEPIDAEIVEDEEPGPVIRDPMTADEHEQYLANIAADILGYATTIGQLLTKITQVALHPESIEWARAQLDQIIQDANDQKELLA